MMRIRRFPCPALGNYQPSLDGFANANLICCSAPLDSGEANANRAAST